MNEPIRVMVVDDSPSTRSMLREALALEGTMEVVAEAGTGREAVMHAGLSTPDVVLMDVRMPDGDGVKAARTILAESPATRIVALTWSDDPGTVREMLSAGAIGYVVKGGTIEELYSAIHRAAGGEPELDQRVLPAAVEDLRRLLEEERQRREAAEALAKARAEFVQVLSHELRTPLTVISGALRMLPGNDLKPEDEALRESALRRAGELEFLVEGLELAASGPTGEGVADPRQAVSTAAARLNFRPDAMNFDDQPWHGIPHRCVERVAFELLSNAMRHGRPPIEVTGALHGLEGILAVTDHGGWTAPDQEFTAFFQEDMSSTRTQGGFGLGLFLAARLCQACDGGLTVKAVQGRTVAEARFRIRWEDSADS
jgi:DNA-binding NarL/FixJ family response regulator